MIVLPVTAMCGCLRGGRQEVLQAELRAQADQLAQLEAEQLRLQAQLKAEKKESDRLRDQIAKQGDVPVEVVEQLGRVESVKIHPLLTAGMDHDGEPGDDLLIVHVAPQSSTGEVLRFPADVEITAQDPALPDGEQTIARWKFAASEMRQYWVRGYLGTGYQFKLPWPESTPRNADLVLRVEMQASDGRELTDTRIVKITPSESSKESTAQAGRPARRDAKSPTGGKDPATRLVGHAEAERKSRRGSPPRVAKKPVDTESAGDEPKAGDDAEPKTRIPRRPPDGLRDSTNWTDESIPRFR